MERCRNSGQKRKPPRVAGAVAIRVCKLLNVGANSDLVFFLGSGSGEFDGQRNIALVAQHVELGRLSGFNGAQFFAKFAGGPDALAVNSSDDVARLYSCLFRGRIAVHVAYKDAFSVGRAEVAA